MCRNARLHHIPCVESCHPGGLGERFKPAVLKTAEGVILP